MEKIDLKSQSLDGLRAFLTDELQEKAFRADQIFQWLHQKQVTAFAEMRNLPRSLISRLEEAAAITVLETVTRRVAGDGTVKYLFRLPDGEMIESVYLLYEEDRKSICISTQAGCAMNCSFCATGLGGWKRNLTPGEMAEQVYAVQRDQQTAITNVVLMGMGEPLINYENSLAAIRLLNHPQGLNIGIRRIALSTCGLAPEIKALAHEDLQLVLAVSLHAANDRLRSQIMPVNRRYPLRELMEACRYYIAVTNRRVSFEYALMEGINDQLQHARELVQLLRGMLCHVNLIPLNPVKETGIGRPDLVQIRKFQQILQLAGIETTLREERGTDIDAACGQLRSHEMEVRA